MSHLYTENVDMANGSFYLDLINSERAQLNAKSLTVNQLEELAHYHLFMLRPQNVSITTPRFAKRIVLQLEYFNFYCKSLVSLLHLAQSRMSLGIRVSLVHIQWFEVSK